MIAVPGETAVTYPVEALTVATVGALEPHCGNRVELDGEISMSGVYVLPTNKVLFPLVILTFVAGMREAETVTWIVSVCTGLLLILTVILVVPGLTPVISPDALTVATDGLLELHVGVNAAPKGQISMPGEYESPACIDLAPPTILMLPRWPVAGITVTWIEFVAAPDVIVIVAVPVACARRLPYWSTEATEGLLEAHVRAYWLFAGTVV
jgi:hypothetical protein